LQGMGEGSEGGKKQPGGKREFGKFLFAQHFKNEIGTARSYVTAMIKRKMKGGGLVLTRKKNTRKT